MGPAEMVVLIVFIATAGKVATAFVRRSALRLPEESERRIASLEAELRSNELRLGQAEEKVADLGEKLIFLENLLSRPEKPRELPPTR